MQFSFDEYLDNIQSVTLAATSTAVTVKRGVPFFVHNNGNAVMYIGHTVALCTTPGIPIYPGQVRGPITLGKSVSIYMRGTALQTAIVEYGNEQTTGGNSPIPAGTSIIGKVGIDQVTANANEVVLKAGSALAGKVGIDQTTPGTTNKVQANIQVGDAAVSGTNSVPIKGDSGAPLATITRPADTNAYAANDVVSTAAGEVMTFSNVLANAAGIFVIARASLMVAQNSSSGMTSGFRLHLYNASPTAIADNAAYNLPSGDRTKYLGYITFGQPVDLGDTVFRQEEVSFGAKLAAASTSLYGILEDLSADTPTSGAVYTLTLNGMGV